MAPFLHNGIRLVKPQRDELKDDLRRLQRDMLQLVSAASSIDELLVTLANSIRSKITLVSLVYFDPREPATSHRQILPQIEDAATNRYSAQLQSLAESALRDGELALRQQEVPARTMVVTPIPHRGSPPSGIGFVLESTVDATQLTLLCQLVSSHVVIWETFRASSDDRDSARHAAATVEMLDRIALAEERDDPYRRLADALSEHLGWQRVVVGTRSTRRRTCQVKAISGVNKLDSKSSSAASIEAALEEVFLHDKETCWPPQQSNRPKCLALKNLCIRDGAESGRGFVISQAEAQSPLGILLLGTPPTPDRSSTFLSAAGGSLAAGLYQAEEARGTWLARRVRSLRRTCRGKMSLLISLVIVAGALGTMFPIPYKVSCDCQLEPVTRRHVVAPFDSTLETTMVQPGDLVQKGTPIARLDGRELRWRKASVTADRDRALKQRDAAQVAHRYGEQQLAQLEVERLELELKEIAFEISNLSVTSPFGGVVVRGDLEREIGAPLTMGTSLFEIAPLDAMLVEVAIPDREIAHADVGQRIDVRLDAYPRERWKAEITEISTQSEIRDNDNVFVALAKLDNNDGRLRPGMKGNAKLITSDKPLGWILFHKPWHFVSRHLGL